MIVTSWGKSGVPETTEFLCPLSIRWMEANNLFSYLKEKKKSGKMVHSF